MRKKKVNIRTKEEGRKGAENKKEKERNGEMRKKTAMHADMGTRKRNREKEQDASRGRHIHRCLSASHARNTNTFAFGTDETAENNWSAGKE